MSECCCIYNSPIGIIRIDACEDGITGVNFMEEVFEESANRTDEMIKCINELDEYFKGDRRKFTVKLSMNGTEFQKKVWKALTEIPYGEIVSYKYIAEKVGSPRGVRAVGGANHNNKLGIIVPCHRVVGVKGALTGYAGGLWRKEWLIKHEKGEQELNI